MSRDLLERSCSFADLQVKWLVGWLPVETRTLQSAIAPRDTLQGGARVPSNHVAPKVMQSYMIGQQRCAGVFQMS